MAKYLWITPQQSHPMDLGSDGKGRIVSRFTVMARKTPSDTFLEELARVLTDLGGGPFGTPPLPFTYNTNVFASNAVSLPVGEGPYLLLIDTGGPFGIRTHNDRKFSYVQPTASVTVYAKSYPKARTMALAAYDAFANVHNAVLLP